MAKAQKYNVPFITETTEIWQVEANTKAEATMKATMARERWRNDGTQDYTSKDAPAHHHVSSFKLGTIAVPVPDPE